MFIAHIETIYWAYGDGPVYSFSVGRYKKAVPRCPPSRTVVAYNFFPQYSRSFPLGLAILISAAVFLGIGTGALYRACCRRPQTQDTWPSQCVSLTLCSRKRRYPCRVLISHSVRSAQAVWSKLRSKSAIISRSC